MTLFQERQVTNMSDKNHEIDDNLSLEDLGKSILSSIQNDNTPFTSQTAHKADNSQKETKENTEAETIQTASNGNTQQNQHSATQYVRRYSHHSGAELCKQPKPIDYLIKGIMRKGGLGMIYGESGCGKSFTVLDMAASIACEKIESWHGLKLHHGPVIYFCGEGADGINARLACWCNEHDINPDSLQLEIFDEVFKLDCDKEDPAHSLENTIAEIKATYEKPALVIFDTLNIYMKAEENSNTDVGRFCLACRKLIQELSCTVFIAHHTGKNTEAKKLARGASALRGAVDFELRLEKSESLLTLKTSKIKDGQEHPNLLFNLRQHEIPGWVDEDGEPVTSCTIELAESLMQYRETKDKEAKEKTLSKTAIQARKTFAQTAKTSGRIIKDENSGHDLAIVYVEDWRKNAYEMSSADRPDTKRKKFNYYREELFEKAELLTKKIIEGREYYCLDLNGEAEPNFRAEIKIAIWDRETAQAKNKTGGSNTGGSGETTNDTTGTLFETP